MPRAKPRPRCRRPRTSHAPPHARRGPCLPCNCGSPPQPATLTTPPAQATFHAQATSGAAVNSPATGRMGCPTCTRACLQNERPSQRKAVSRPAMASEGSRKNQRSHASGARSFHPLSTRAGPIWTAPTTTTTTPHPPSWCKPTAGPRAHVVHRRGPMFCTRRGEARNVSLFGLMRIHILAP